MWLPPDQKRRLEAWKPILDALHTLSQNSVNVDLALGSVGFLMMERTEVRYRHNREMREEASDAQRGARSAYHEGFIDASRNEW